jgi:hypothetical protein
MISIDENMKKVLLIYLIGCAVLYKTKPDIMFSNKGEFKQFGVGPYKTITPYWLVSLIIGLIGYLYVTIQSNSFIEN